MYNWLELRRAALSLLMPNRCPFCDGIVGMSEYWCESCYGRLHFIGEELALPEHIDGMLSCCYYTGRARSAILRMKEGHYCYSIDAFAVLMTERAADIMPRVDILTAVPTSFKRRQELGYAQAEKIACAIAERSRKKFRRVLKVNSGKLEQKRLNRQERRENAMRSYKIRDNKYIIGKNILIVDDVATTGATLSAIAGMLKQAGAASVYALTFAKVADKD